MLQIIGILIVILGMVVLTFLTYKNYEPQVKKFIKNHIVDSFDNHYDPRCFDCNRGSCIEPQVCHIITEKFEIGKEE
jgi:hypothetical protein